MEEKDNMKHLENVTKRKIMADISKDNAVEQAHRKQLENKYAMVKHKEEVIKLKIERIIIIIDSLNIPFPIK